jgi:hypothetical protein
MKSTAWSIAPRRSSSIRWIPAMSMIELPDAPKRGPGGSTKWPSLRDTFCMRPP